LYYYLDVMKIKKEFIRLPFEFIAAGRGEK